MDAETVRILSQILEVQLKQNELLQRVARQAAHHEMNSHVYVYHGGSKLHGESGVVLSRIEEQLRQNQENLLELVRELSKAPASIV